MLSFDALFDLVSERCAGHQLQRDEKSSPKAIAIPGSEIHSVCDFLYKNPTTFFDMLSCLTALDHGPEAGTMEVVYNLYSIPFNHHLALKVIVSREAPAVPSVQSIWRTANWHEREAFDMYGIHFQHHPDLRRILLPADWEGYPLRKDYKQQERYRNIKLDY